MGVKPNVEGFDCVCFLSGFRQIFEKIIRHAVTCKLFSICKQGLKKSKCLYWVKPAETV